jgi:hypothetical protein
MEETNYLEKAKQLRKKLILLDRIDRNGGWIDHIDAFELISVYVEDQGIIYTTLSIEEELSLMYYRLKGYKVFEEDFTQTKIKKCLKCGIKQKLTNFSKNWSYQDNRSSRCNICMSKDPEQSRKEWNENELKKKVCPTCQREYTLNDFLKKKKICKRCNNRNKEHEPKTTNRDMLEKRRD